MPDKLKKGWKIWRFDQMATMVNERVDNPEDAGVEYYVGLEHLDPESLTIRRWGSPSDVAATKLLFRKGDIIFGRRRVYQRKLAVAHFDGICSAHAMVLRAKPDIALPDFLPFFMQSDLFMERAKQISVGSLSPTINWKTLAQEEFALPPLDEQRRIAEVLGAINQAFKSWWQTIQFFDKLYDAVSRTFFKHSTSERNEITNSWRRCKFEEVAMLQRGHDLPIDQREPGDIAVCGAKGICGSHSKEMYKGPGVITGRSGTIGETYFIEKNYWPLNTTLFVKEFYGNNPKFVYHLLKSLNCKRFSAGSAVPTLNRSDIHSITVCVPKPSEQAEIADKFDSIERFGMNISQHYNKIVEMRKRVLVTFLEDNAP